MVRKALLHAQRLSRKERGRARRSSTEERTPAAHPEETTPEGGSPRAEAMLRLQRSVGNRRTGQLLGLTAPTGSPSVQRDIEMPEMHITGDPQFYPRAERRNRHWSTHSPQPGWPYADELRALWEADSYDDFADAVRTYQVDLMGQTLDEADGILGPNTAAAMETLPYGSAPPPRPAVAGAEEAEGEAAAGGGSEGEAETSRAFSPVRASVRSQATSSPWPFHEQIYNQWRSEGRSLGISGLADDWQGFLGQMREMDFMGHRVVGHEAFLARLEQAQQTMRTAHPDLAERDLVPGVGSPGSRAQWRAGEGTTSYHVFGLAIDVAPGTNPWLSDPSLSATTRNRIVWTTWRAAWLTGSDAEAIWPAQSVEWARAAGADTAALYRHFADTDAAVSQYFGLLDNAEGLQARAQALGDQPAQPPSTHPYTPPQPSIETLAGGDVDAWRGVMAGDQTAWPVSPATEGFMSLRQELVEAMRGAGLSWGAAEMGARESGDFMHFDLRNPQFERFRNAVRTAISEAREPIEGQMGTLLTDAYIAEEIAALGVPANRRARFETQMRAFFGQTLSRGFSRWTDAQRENWQQTLRDAWNASSVRARYAPRE